jgi:hypothetical protein
MIRDYEFNAGFFRARNLPNTFSPSGAEEISELLEKQQVEIAISVLGELVQPTQALRRAEFLHAHIRHQVIECGGISGWVHEIVEVADGFSTLAINRTEKEFFDIDVLDASPFDCVEVVLRKRSVRAPWHNFAVTNTAASVIANFRI